MSTQTEFEAMKAEDRAAQERRHKMIMFVLEHRPEWIRNWADSLQVAGWGEASGGSIWRRSFWQFATDHLYIVGRRGPLYFPALAMVGFFIEWFLTVSLINAFAYWSVSGWTWGSALWALPVALKALTSSFVIWRLVAIARRPVRDQRGRLVRLVVFVLVASVLTLAPFLGPCHTDFLQGQWCSDANWRLVQAPWLAFPLLTLFLAVLGVAPLMALSAYNILAMVSALSYFGSVGFYLLWLVLTSSHMPIVYEMKYHPFTISGKTWCLASADPWVLNEDARYFRGLAEVLKNAFSIYAVSATAITVVIGVLALGPFQGFVSQGTATVAQAIAAISQPNNLFGVQLAGFGVSPGALLILLLVLLVVSLLAGAAFGLVSLLVIAPAVAVLLEEHMGRVERDQASAKRIDSPSTSGALSGKSQSLSQLLSRRTRAALRALLGER